MFVILLLAAGQGRRFRDAGGDTFKLLAPVEASRTALRQSYELLMKTGWPVYVVTGAHELEIRRELDGLNVRFIPNPNAESGLGSSIACGVEATIDADGWLLALADMPYIRYESVEGVARALENGAAIAFPEHEGRRGHPVGFSRRFASDLIALTGDTGAQRILSANKDVCVAVPVSDDGILRDVDFPSDVR